MSPRGPADRVERWAIDSLLPYARNARTHSPGQVDQIAASMREWGWTTPVLVDEGGMIIAGHGPIEAARMLGLTEAPVMIAASWSEAKKRAYAIADNKLALNAWWNEELLAAELSDLRELAFDIDLVGFDAGELERLLGSGDTVEGEDEVPDAPDTPVSRAQYGLLTKSLNAGLPLQSPYLAILNKQAQIMLKAGDELGFSPASRTRVQVANERVSPLAWLQDPRADPESLLAKP